MKFRLSATTVPRLIGASSVTLGVTLLSTPGRVSDYLSDSGALPAGWVRLLGARYLVQGVAQLGWPRPAVLQGSALVDGLHAASMVALATVRPDYRRAAKLSAFVATAGVAANALTARHSKGLMS